MTFIFIETGVGAAELFDGAVEVVILRVTASVD